ncbi:MAG: lipopolysaccharide biosynthesis protein [Candidatus Latescibacteria bacterium]|nr:lipopolysaccharide biosynthesis protein [Candidatus Latescibacterota bacterium]
MAEQSLATRAVRGAVWTGGGLAVQMAVSMVFFMVLPLAVMGQFDFALRVVTLISLVSALGMNEALVQFQEAEESHFSTAFWMCLGAGLLSCLFILGAVPFLSQLSDDPQGFQTVLLPLLVYIPFAAVSGIFRAQLARALRFRAVAFADLLAVLVAAFVSALCLLLGYGIWGVIWNAIAREICLMLALWWASRWCPKLMFSWAALRQLLRFGLNVTGANGINYLANNLDKLIVFPVLGDRAQGLYSFAYRFTMMPLSRAAQVLTKVSFPTFSKVQNDDAALRRAYLRTVSMTALGAWPVLAGASVFAPEFLLWVKGETMMDGLMPLRLLIFAGMFKAVGTVVGSIFLAKGKAHWSFRWSLVSLFIFLFSLLYGVQYGLAGVAGVISMIAFFALFVTQMLVNRLIGLPFIDYFRVLVRPAVIACMVAGVLWGVKPMISFAPLLALSVGGVVGGCVYMLGVRLLAWPLVMRFWNDFRGKS